MKLVFVIAKIFIFINQYNMQYLLNIFPICDVFMKVLSCSLCQSFLSACVQLFTGHFRSELFICTEFIPKYRIALLLKLEWWMFCFYVEVHLCYSWMVSFSGLFDKEV